MKFKLMRLNALLLVFVSLLTACGGGSKPTAPASPAPAPAPALAPAQPKELKKVKIVYTIENIIFAPLFVAMERGYFKDEGLAADVFQMAGGDATAGVLSGSVDFLAGNGNSVTATHGKGVPDLIAVGNVVSKATAIMVMRNEQFKERQLSPSMPVLDRLKSLKGITFGVLNPGSADDNLLNLYLEQAGLKRDVDVQVVAVGTGAGMVASLSQNQIQAFMASPTVPNLAVAQGYASIVVPGGEVDGTKDISWDALITRKALIQKDEDLVMKVARAMARGNNFARDPKNSDATLAVIKKRFASVDEVLLKAGLAYMITSDAWPKDSMMTEQVWKNQTTLDKRSGSLKVDIDTKEGVFWTNKYLLDVKGKAD